MTEEQRTNVLISLDSRIGKLQKIQDLLKGLRHPEDCPGRISSYVTDIHIDISTMEELHQVRTFLRNEFGTWEDKLFQIFASYEAYALWIGEIQGIEVRIYLSCPVEKFPKELQHDGCGFKQVTRTETAYVCNKENE